MDLFEEKESSDLILARIPSLFRPIDDMVLLQARTRGLVGHVPNCEWISSHDNVYLLYHEHLRIP